MGMASRISCWNLILSQHRGTIGGSPSNCASLSFALSGYQSSYLLYNRAGSLLLGVQRGRIDSWRVETSSETRCAGEGLRDTISIDGGDGNGIGNGYSIGKLHRHWNSRHWDIGISMNDEFLHVMTPHNTKMGFHIRGGWMEFSNGAVYDALAVGI